MKLGPYELGPNDTPAKGIMVSLVLGLLLWAGMGGGVCLLLQLLTRLGWFWYDGAMYTEGKEGE